MPLRDSAHLPVATQRIQLHGKFAFADLVRLMPYFRGLGISDFYLSPIFASTPGSRHGYDVIDYGRVNPELGGADGFDLFCAQVRAGGGAVILDFVPNHMGIAGVLNEWWRDTLEHGPLSPHAAFFDIQWKSEPPDDHPRVLVPVLEDHYGRVLERGKLVVAFDGEFSLHYGDLSLPLRPDSYPSILRKGSGRGLFPELIALLAEPGRTAADRAAALKLEFAARIAANADWQKLLAARLEEMNGQVGDPRSFDELDGLIGRQHYRLARWQAGAHEINYRRFFAIDSLVGLHMENPEVFRETHALLGQFVREGKVAGLRIDHIDGLRQPEDYLRRIQSLDRPDPSRPLYVAVEKILARSESLPEAWPVHGTTGYEFILQLADILVDGSAQGRFDEIYRRATGDQASYAEAVDEKKRLIREEMFGNAFDQLGAELALLVARDRIWRDLTRHELTGAIAELVVHLPVYRTYRRRRECVAPADRAVLDAACARAIAANPRADPQPIQFVRDLLAGAYPEAGAPEDYRARLLDWVLTLQQYTGAVMAKSVEDTVFYTYNRLVALNEVGGDPSRFGGSMDAFHRANAARLSESPHAMLTTSTHDTKMSEDVRARLYALSELADDWEAWVRDWHRDTSGHLSLVDGRDAPDAVDRHRFFQVLLGVWPLEENGVDEGFRARLKEHFRKSVAEAKRHTSILRPNDAYMAACDRFVDGLTIPELGRDFLTGFVPCAQRISRLGMVNSLAQLVLKCTVPGIPDFYQGDEIWNFSLVDPDNRRPVDYELRQGALAGAGTRPAAVLLANWRDGGIKLWTMQRLLELRRRHPATFAEGAYEPVAGQGGFGDRVIAFIRSGAGAAVLVAAPRLTEKLGAPPVGPVWDDTRLADAAAANAWRDIFTGRTFAAGKPLFLRALLAELPFAVLERI